MNDRAALLQGTLDLLIRKSLQLEALHGRGSLYPALYRLEDRRLTVARWGISPERRRAKFYRLIACGRKQLDTERASWRMFTGAVGHVLDAA